MGQRHGLQLLRCATPGLEAVTADTSRAFARHTHEEFGLGLILRGAQRSASGRGKVDASAGDVITVNPGEVHDGQALGDGGRAWQMLYLAPSLLAPLARDIQPHRSFEFTAPVVQDSQLATHYRVLLAAAMASGEPLRFEAALLAMLGRLIRPASEPPMGVNSGVLRARQQIDDDPGAHPMLGELASQAGLSRYQFLRAFTRLTGLPPHAYLLQRRTQLARRLLRSGLAPADAACASGFADQSHMTRCLVRCFGMTPGMLRPARA